MVHLPACHESQVHKSLLLLQAVVNEDRTSDALLLQKENERLRKELDMFRQLQQVSSPSASLPVSHAFNHLLACHLPHAH